MSLYCKNDNYTLYCGMMQDELNNLEENSIDSIITDPPYELGFMCKTWDSSGVAFQKETWEKCLRVLKPGGYLLAFGGSRTYHRIACAIEDAGFEIRDTIMWLYGCLSEDTRILTRKGFKYYNEITENDEIRIYDIKSGIYKWEKPERWNIYKTEQDTLFRIKSDFTDQLVSRNHRCLIERNGKLVFEFAENLNSVERVPILSFDIPYLQKESGCILFTDLLWQGEGLADRLLCEWERKEESKEGIGWGEKPILERWGNLSEEEREVLLLENKVCSLPGRVYADGEKRWVCNGTQASSCNGTWETSVEIGDRASYKPQCGGQQVGKFDVVCKQQGSQTLREWNTYNTTLATIIREEYTGVIFCPTVSTGCFVAERNGQVFITGNSGFPKSMNIGKAIEGKLTIGSSNVKDIKKLDGITYSVSCGFNSTGKETGYRDKEYELTKTDVTYHTELGKNWDSWGTALKPAFEPIIVARKPFTGSLVDNVLEWGVGGLNIDECRVGDDYISGGTAPDLRDVGRKQKEISGIDKLSFGQVRNAERVEYEGHFGRFPANIITDGSDEVAQGFPQSKGASSQNNFSNGHIYRGQSFNESSSSLEGYRDWYNDDGSAMRYFYCAKASKKDRDEGLECFIKQKVGDGRIVPADNPFQRGETLRHNIHPTVKPTDLMQYLIRLVSPKGSTILDPFMGSGSTGKACMIENQERNAGYKFIGVEMTGEYLPIADARIRYWVDTQVDYTEEVVRPKEDKKEVTVKLW